MPGSVSSPKRVRDMSAFFFWTSWSAVTKRPDDSVSYTNNWPHEPLVGNLPSGDNIVWTGLEDNARILGLVGGTNHYDRVYRRFDGIYRRAGALAARRP